MFSLLLKRFLIEMTSRHTLSSSLTSRLRRFSPKELQQYYLEEVAPRYRRTLRQRRRLPHYILRCEPERSAGYIYGFNTLRALLDYLSICHAGVCPPSRSSIGQGGRSRVETITLLHEKLSAMRAQGDAQVNLEAVVELSNQLLEDSCYINIIDVSYLCSSSSEEARREREILREELNLRRRGDVPLSRRERITYLQTFYPETLPPEVS